MKTVKIISRVRFPVILISLILLGNLFVNGGGETSAYMYLGGYQVTDGEDLNTSVPQYLTDGEIITGKAVKHNGDGTITVTLYAWGKSYGEQKQPLAGDNCVTIVDDLGCFQAVGNLPDGVVKGGDNTVVWKVQQNYILGDSPAVISYDLELKDISDGLKTEYWYQTGTAVSRFTPAEGNPFYWTKTETTYDSFSVSMNWNNGKGLNEGIIIDKLLDSVFVLGSNTSAEKEDPYGPNAHWDKFIFQGMERKWHLNWTKGNQLKSYFFTLKDMGGPGIDIVYQIDFTSPGGNESITSGRTVKSDNFFHRSFEEGSQENFVWDGNDIAVKLDAEGKIKLLEDSGGTPPKGSLTVNIILDGFPSDWDIDGETQFTAIVQDKQTGDYLTFETIDGEPPNQYTYDGESAIGDQIKFTADEPSIINDIPADRTYIVEVIFENGHNNNADTLYAPNEIFVGGGQNAEETITNNYKHSTGNIVIRKLFDGFPSDWGVNSSTVFGVKIKDVAADNYLLFKSVPEADGSYRCVGNDVDGLRENYGGKTITEIPVNELHPISLSNIWAGTQYNVEETVPYGPNLYNGNREVVYSDNNGKSLVADESMYVMVTNRYKYGAGNLVIYTKLDDFPSDSGITNSTVFTAKIADVTEGDYLIFKAVPEVDGSYRCVGNDVDGLIEDYDGEIMSEVPFSADKPVILSNLSTGSEHFYRIEESHAELFADNFKTSYSDSDVTGTIESGGSMIITIINTYENKITKPETTTEQKAVAVPETTAKPEAAAVPETETEPETVAVLETTAKPEAAAVPETEIEPETVAEPETETEPEAVAEPETTTEPEAVAELETTTEPETVAELETAAKSKMATALETITKPGSVAEFETTAEPESTTENPPKVNPLTGDYFYVIWVLAFLSIMSAVIFINGRANKKLF